MLALADPAVADAWLHGSGSPQELTQTELSQFTTSAARTSSISKTRSTNVKKDC